MNKELQESKFLLYETDDGNINVDVVLNDENIWLTQKGMSELFDKDVKTINRHILNIFEDEELIEKSTISFFEIVQNENGRKYNR